MIETDRLIIMPLTARELRLWITDIPAFEKAVGCKYQGEPVAGRFIDVVKGQIKKIENNESSFLYHTFWLIMRKSDRIVMGSAAFKGSPDKDGLIEIGYGLAESFQHKGYMTEAVNRNM